MRIRWLDKRGGLIDLSRWEGISHDKAQAMLKRADAHNYHINKYRLMCGEEVILDKFALKEDDTKYLIQKF